MKISDFVPGILGGDTDDAVSLLMADHDKVKGLFKRFEEIKDVSDQHGAKERKHIVAEACKELNIHTAIEDEIFYPAVRAAIKDDDLMNEAKVEHDGAKTLIGQLEKMSEKDPMFTAKFTVLSEYVKHHIKEEHEEMFPKARKSGLDLEALGKKLRARRQQLMTGAKPATARAPARKRAVPAVKPGQGRQAVHAKL
jgi:hypothetical protein